MTAAPTADNGTAEKCDDSNDPACKEKRKKDGINEEVAAKQEKHKEKRKKRRKT